MKQDKRNIRVGFIGNPNCGKTTLFNAYTGADLKVANWPGVTVERVEGGTDYEGIPIHIIDLPGIYSLASYTIEETVARNCLEGDELDVIVNVVDVSSLERNLYLTLQLLELKKPVVLALNMMDIAEKRGIIINLNCLSKMLGNIPVVAVSAKKRSGLSELMQAVVYQEDCGQNLPELEIPEKQQRYQNIEKILNVCVEHNGNRIEFTDRIDAWLTHPVLGIPILLGIMAAVFFLTFTAGDWLKEYFQVILEFCTAKVQSGMELMQVSPWMSSLVIDGILAGVGGILIFLPNIFILFLALAFLEDCGYMARAAYVMDGVMGWAGLPGKAFLPMLLGFGCTVPAVMAARVLKGRRQRIRTIWIVPFMSCSARLPIYVLFSKLFFPEQALPTAYSLYLIGLLTAILTAFMLGRLDQSQIPRSKRQGIDPHGIRQMQEYKHSEEEALLIELPEYRIPDKNTVFIYVWDKVKDYVIKAGTTIFAASILIWFLLNTGTHGFTEEISLSFAARIGHMLEPVLRPAGLDDWRIAVALISGLSAKEVVVSSFSVLFGISGINSAEGMSALSVSLKMIGFDCVNAYALMVFCLLYTPCIAAIGTIKRETGSWFITCGMAGYQMLVAWCMSVLVYQLGSCLFLML